MRSSKVLLGLAATLLMRAVAMADPPSDEQTNAQAQALFQQHPDLGPTTRSLTKNGVVYISGTVATSLQKQSAEELASGVAGVIRFSDNVGLDKGGG